MGSKTLPLIDNGIYHSLPQFPASVTGLRAIITGANGISGFGTLRCLLEHPKRWSKIYLISRRELSSDLLRLLPSDTASRIQHISIDLQTDSDRIAHKLAGVQADYVFYYAYLQPRPEEGSTVWSNDEELVRVNAGMIQNFLGALVKTGIRPKRFLLQTGGKNYGVHLGRGRTPCLESDPQPRHLAPNFYYVQEDILFKYCAEHRVDWNVIMPPWIIGAASVAQMNAMLPFAIYAAVAAERDTALIFPYSWLIWQAVQHHGTARLTGYLSEWAVLEDRCKNGRFNSTDNSPLSLDRFFEALANWFNVRKGVQAPPVNEANMTEISIGGDEKNPMGYGPPTSWKVAKAMALWAKDPDNIKAYATIMKREGLKYDPFHPGVAEDQFAFADMSMLPGGPLSMNKARRLGWTGFVDTLESIFEMYQEMYTLGMCPPLKVENAHAVV